MRPAVGRIVHYTNLGDKDGKYPPEQQAAIITKVHQTGAPDETDPVSLHIFYPTGNFNMERVCRASDYQRGFWTWAPVEVL